MDRELMMYLSVAGMAFYGLFARKYVYTVFCGVGLLVLFAAQRLPWR